MLCVLPESRYRFEGMNSVVGTSVVGNHRGVSTRTNPNVCGVCVVNGAEPNNDEIGTGPIGWTPFISVAQSNSSDSTTSCTTTVSCQSSTSNIDTLTSVVSSSATTPTNNSSPQTAASPFPFGYARSHAEATGVNDGAKFRQLPCRTFISSGSCPYRDRCVYLHDPRVAQVESLRMKIKKKNKEDIVLDSMFWPCMSPVDVSKRVDSHNQPLASQIYTVPTPKPGDSFCRHDRAIYSLWNHYVFYCEAESQSQLIRSNQQRQMNAFNSNSNSCGTPLMNGNNGNNLRNSPHSPRYGINNGNNGNNGSNNYANQVVETNYSFNPDRRALIMSFANTSLMRPHLRNNEFTQRERLSVFVSLSLGRKIVLSPEELAKLPVIDPAPVTSSTVPAARSTPPTVPLLNMAAMTTPPSGSSKGSGKGQDVMKSPSTVAITSPTAGSTLSASQGGIAMRKTYSGGNINGAGGAVNAHKAVPVLSSGLNSISNNNNMSSCLDEESERELSAFHKSQLQYSNSLRLHTAGGGSKMLMPVLQDKWNMSPSSNSPRWGAAGGATSNSFSWL